NVSANRNSNNVNHSLRVRATATTRCKLPAESYLHQTQTDGITATFGRL
mgnify:CR=1